MKKELIEESQRFLKNLDTLLIHIAVYLIVNISLVVFIFTDFTSFWWLLFPLIFWSLILIYHAIQLADKNNTSVKKVLLGLLFTN